MFSYLKEKLKGAIAKISKKVEEAPVEKVEVVETPEVPEKVVEPVIEEKKVEKKSFMSKVAEKVTTKKITEEKFNELFWELESVLLENNVAVEVIDKIKEDLQKDLVDTPIKRGKVAETILTSLKESIDDLFLHDPINLVAEAKKKKPYVIVFLGVNGSGKTTTVAKVAHVLLQHKLTCVLVAADTFRAGAEEQLQEHGDKLGVKVIKHGYGADPAAVGFDGIKYAKAHAIDVVLVDTAGRQHSNVNLMQQMEKIVRVVKPDLRVFVGESITGNDCVVQSKEFNDAVGIDAIILTKADVDEKGGAAVSISYVTHRPILYLGKGQAYDDLELFDKNKIIKNIGL